MGCFLASLGQNFHNLSLGLCRRDETKVNLIVIEQRTLSTIQWQFLSYLDKGDLNTSPCGWYCTTDPPTSETALQQSHNLTTAISQPHHSNLTTAISQPRFSNITTSQPRHSNHTPPFSLMSSTQFLQNFTTYSVFNLRSFFQFDPSAGCFMFFL